MKTKRSNVFYHKAIHMHYLFIPVALIVVFILNYWLGMSNLRLQIGIVLVYFTLTHLFTPSKYIITEHNNLVIYTFFGLIKRKSIDIDKIVSMQVKDFFKLNVNYDKEAPYPSSITLELNEMDLKEIQQLLLLRNPRISA